jgi:hypothetical protein
VTSVVAADEDGIVSLAHGDLAGGLRVYHSREAGQPPRLIYVVATPGPPVPAVSTGGAVAIAVLLLGIGPWVLVRVSIDDYH